MKVLKLKCFELISDRQKYFQFHSKITKENCDFRWATFEGHEVHAKLEISTLTK